MRQIKLAILLLGIPAFLGAQTDPSGRVGRLNYVNGPVSLQPAGMDDWVDAGINRPLTTGDQVWVGGGGRAEIHVGSTALRLDSNTAFQFLNLDDRTIQIQLSQGTLTVRVRNLGRDQILELDTPSLALTVLRPGEYRIDAEPDSQTTTVTVRDGDSDVTGGGQGFPVHAGQQAIVVGGEQITYSLVLAPRPDGWDQWSLSRDRREDRSISARYVSREMDGYEDLDQYGSWASQPGYGQVWMPATVAAGWAPYHDGHWAWIAPWGWTWVDDAPWGFAPYHYGRWANFSGRWGWVPGPYGVTPLYAPALVGWVGGGRGGSGFSLSFSFGNAEAVGWFPLGPHEPYFPAYSVSSGYFGRVNHTNTEMSSATINNYYEGRSSNGAALASIGYANQTVPNAITAVPQDRFANGRRVGETARPVSGVSFGTSRFAAAPEIAPQRASILGPQAGDASRAARPPANVLSRPVVARTAPPQASVPFERQQTELNRNPGRPLPQETVQQMGRSLPSRSSPVRVEDMTRVQRIQPTVGGGSQQGARRVNSAPGEANPPPPNAQQRPPVVPPPVFNNPRNQTPSNPAGSPNGRWSVPVARPDRPLSNTVPRQNTPPPNTGQQPNAAAPPVFNRQTEPPSNQGGSQNSRSPQTGRPDRPPSITTPRKQETLPPDAGQRPDAARPVFNRQSESPQVTKPDAPPANTNPRQPGTPPPDNNRSNEPQSRRQQPEQRERIAPPSQPNRPQAQDPQREPPQQAKPAPVETPEPASRPKGAKGKPDKNDEKKQ